MFRSTNIYMYSTTFFLFYIVSFHNFEQNVYKYNVDLDAFISILNLLLA